MLSFLKGTGRFILLAAGVLAFVGITGELFLGKPSPPPAHATRSGRAASPRASDPDDAAARAYLAAARAYLRAHPVPPRPGMVAGIAVGEYSSPGTGSWSQTILTTSGRSLTVSCGNPVTRVTCSWDGPDPYLAGVGVLGSYEYVPASGDARKPGDIRVIKKGAVR